MGFVRGRSCRSRRRRRRRDYIVYPANVDGRISAGIGSAGAKAFGKPGKGDDEKEPRISKPR